MSSKEKNASASPAAGAVTRTPSVWDLELSPRGPSRPRRFSAAAARRRGAATSRRRHSGSRARSTRARSRRGASNIHPLGVPQHLEVFACGNQISGAAAASHRFCRMTVCTSCHAIDAIFSPHRPSQPPPGRSSASGLKNMPATSAVKAGGGEIHETSHFVRAVVPPP